MKIFEFNLGRAIAVILLILVLVLAITCSKPFEPQPPRDYPFYIANIYPSSELFIFHPATNKLDSVSIPWYPYPGITVSADGKLLYIAQGTSVAVLETDSFSLVTELMYPQDYPVVVSPDNKLIAITGDDSLVILRTSDYTVFFSDTSEAAHGVFSDDSRSFYCSSRISQDSSYLVFKVDLSDTLFPVTRKGFVGRSVVHILPSPDESKLFLYSVVASWVSAFEVYDVANDSIIFSHLLSPGAGSIAMTPDGNYVFYTWPGRTATDPPADFSFFIFDVAANDIDTIIKDPEFFSDSTWFGYPKLVSTSPDGKWLGIVGGQHINISFYTFDIVRKELKYRRGPGGSLLELSNLTVQGQK
jgi:DNA-binding beta-propeller fold protein YncE